MIPVCEDSSSASFEANPRPTRPPKIACKAAYALAGLLAGAVLLGACGPSPAKHGSVPKAATTTSQAPFGSGSTLGKRTPEPSTSTTATLTRPVTSPYTVIQYPSSPKPATYPGPAPSQTSPSQTSPSQTQPPTTAPPTSQPVSSATTQPVTTTSCAIPQGGGGDDDNDNHGGLSDGDGCL